MTDFELHELIPLHALAALEPDQAVALEAYLIVNPEAQASYLWYLEAVTVLARALVRVEPPTDLKSRMLDRVRRSRVTSLQGFSDRSVSDRSVSDQRVPNLSVEIGQHPIRPQTSRIHRHRSRLPIPLAVISAISAIAGLMALQFHASNTINTLEASQRQLEQMLASNETTLAILNTPDNHTQVGRVFTTRDGRLLITHSMGKLHDPKTWQAWYIRKGETIPRSLGTTNESYLLIQLPPDASAKIKAIAVSEERAGGSPIPTTIRALATL
jgi:Anti-sigma-K factor rskA